MRIVAGIMLVLLAACQSPSGRDGEPGETTTDSSFELSKTLNEWFDTNIPKVCGVVTLTSGDKDCARGMLLVVFDTSGEARRNCPSDTSIDHITECVVFGSIGYELLARSGEGQEANFDWQAPATGLQATFDTIVYNNGMSCLGWEPSTSGSCFRRQLTSSLGLSEVYDTICGSKDGEQWEHCILDAFFTNKLHEASLRI